MGAPRRARPGHGSFASSGLAAANELGTGVQLNGDGLDPGLVAAELVVSQLAAAAQVAFAT